jgi:two-component system, cell cycle response regulator DivK
MKSKILIIEDNIQNMYMLAFLLEHNNYEVIQAYTGEDGITIAQKIKPDIILLDIQLPEMDGYTVTRKLRACEGIKKTPIIAVTSFAMVGEKEKAIEAGATGYIEKPVDPENFIMKMTKIINNSSMGDL